MNLTTINQLIKRSGLKKKYIARKVGIKQMELSHILHKRRTPKPELLKQIYLVVSTNQNQK